MNLNTIQELEGLRTMRTFVIFLMLVFFGILLFYTSTNSPMWIKRYGRRHRLTGLLMLCWLLLGFVLVFHGGYGDRIDVWICYDIMLGVLGIATAYTAASDFKIAHSGPHIRNKASGVLDEDATVTYSEMIEHVFYQILNLVQIIYLHSLSTGIFKDYNVDARHSTSIVAEESFSSFIAFLSSEEAFGSIPGILRLIGGILVTLPWLFRNRFPINKFQDNYNRGQDPWSFNAIMYRSKKYQYVFYKHWMLHGLNATMALPFLATSLYLPLASSSLSSSLDGEGNYLTTFFSKFYYYDNRAAGVHLVNSEIFRMYWLCLNLSYVMEFFMQTLVKRNYMSQSMMMILQRILMTASTITAIGVVRHVYTLPAILSLLLMIIRRKQELSNFVMVLFGTSLLHYLSTYQPSHPALFIFKVGTSLLVLIAGVLHARGRRRGSGSARPGGHHDRHGDTEDDTDTRRAIKKDTRTFVLR